MGDDVWRFQHCRHRAAATTRYVGRGERTVNKNALSLQRH